MDAKTLRGKGFAAVVVIRIIIGLARFLFDIPKFLFFLVHGSIRPEGYRRK